MISTAGTTPTSLDRGNSYSSYISRGSEKDSWTPQASYQPLQAPPSPPPMNQAPTSYFPQLPVDAGPSRLQQPQASSSGRSWRDNDIVRTLEDIKRPLELHEDEDDEDYFDEDDPSEEGDDRFFNPSLLSHIAVRLKDKVPRGTHVKGSIPYPRAFTGKDIVVSSKCAPSIWVQQLLT